MPEYFYWELISYLEQRPCLEARFWTAGHEIYEFMNAER